MTKKLRKKLLKKKEVGRKKSLGQSNFFLRSVENFAGFSLENKTGGGYVKVLTRARLISDFPDFYTYIEEISNSYFNKINISQNSVYQFIVLIHQDLSSHVYVNDFSYSIEISAKRDMEKGQVVRENDIADIRRLKFDNIEVRDSDKVICCFKVGWKFMLYFDLNRETPLNIEQMYLDLGELYRYLSFQYVYNIIEAEKEFEQFTQDGWFPFIEIIGQEVKKLVRSYKHKFQIKEETEKLAYSFNKERIERLTNKWWANNIYKDKQEIIQAGINSYIRGNKEDYISCIKTLLPEIEGIIRIHYFHDTGKGKDVYMHELLKHLTEKGKQKTGSDVSLYLPIPFLNYLKEVVFPKFDLEVGEVSLTRHTASHGVAKSEDYTQVKALQAILILDQIYFYL